MFKAVFGQSRHTAEHLARFLPPDVAAVLDLGALEVCRAASWTRLLFKHIRDKDLEQRLPRWLGLFRKVVAEGTSGLQGLGLILEYVTQAAEGVSVDDIFADDPPNED